MISSPSRLIGIFTPSRFPRTMHSDMLMRTRGMAVHAVDSTWTGATQIAKVVGISMVVVPMAPVALAMWLAQGMQHGRELASRNCSY
jgi:hypothetical protein